MTENNAYLQLSIGFLSSKLKLNSGSSLELVNKFVNKTLWKQGGKDFNPSGIVMREK